MAVAGILELCLVLCCHCWCCGVWYVASLSGVSCRALAEVMKYDVATTVQAQSVLPCLQGVDMVCKAKTGTGKTLAFLIPALERVSMTTEPVCHLASYVHQS